MRRLVAWWPALVLVALAVWVVAPMYRELWWQSHENIWYPVRVHEYLRSWEAGTWYPRWCPNLYGGYGYPFLNYYAPGTYFGGAVVTKLFGLTTSEGLKALIVFVTAVSVVGVYGAMRGEVKRSDAAFVGAAIYVLLPYRCADLFWRGDLAEYSAYCIVPFVLWGYRAIGRTSGRARTLAACGAALAHAATLMTHTLLGMFTTELVGLYLLHVLWRERRVRGEVLLLGVTMLLAIALAAVYIGPAFFERKLVHLERISQAQFTPWQNALTRPMLFAPWLSPSWPFFGGAALWFILLLVPGTRRAAGTRRGRFGTAIVMVLLCLPGVVLAWKALPFGAEVQFPWRLLGFVGLFTALGIAQLWALLLPKRPAVVAVALLVTVPLVHWVRDYRVVALERFIPWGDKAIRDEFATSTAMNEYWPARASIDPPWPRRADAWSETPGIEVTSVRRSPLALELDVNATIPGTVAVGTFGFQGWKLEMLEGPARPVFRFSYGDGLQRLKVLLPGHYRLVIRWSLTRFRLFAALLSALALVALYPLLRTVTPRTRSETVP